MDRKGDNSPTCREGGQDVFSYVNTLRLCIMCLFFTSIINTDRR